MLDPDDYDDYNMYAFGREEMREVKKLFRRIKCIKCGHVEVKSKNKPAGCCVLCGGLMVEVEDD